MTSDCITVLLLIKVRDKTFVSVNSVEINPGISVKGIGDTTTIMECNRLIWRRRVINLKVFLCTQHRLNISNRLHIKTRMHLRTATFIRNPSLHHSY